MPTSSDACFLCLLRRTSSCSSVQIVFLPTYSTWLTYTQLIILESTHNPHWVIFYSMLALMAFRSEWVLKPSLSLTMIFEWHLHLCLNYCGAHLVMNIVCQIIMIIWHCSTICLELTAIIPLELLCLSVVISSRLNKSYVANNETLYLKRC